MKVARHHPHPHPILIIINNINSLSTSGLLVCINEFEISSPAGFPLSSSRCVTKDRGEISKSRMATWKKSIATRDGEPWWTSWTVRWGVKLVKSKDACETHGNIWVCYLASLSMILPIPPISASQQDTPTEIHPEAPRTKNPRLLTASL